MTKQLGRTAKGLFLLPPSCYLKGRQLSPPHSPNADIARLGQSRPGAQNSTQVSHVDGRGSSLKPDFKKNIYFLFDLQTGGGEGMGRGERQTRGRDFFHLLVQSPNGCHSWCLARLNQRPGTASASPLGVAGPKHLGRFLLLSQAH